MPAVFDRYSNSFLKIYFDIPEGREDELARKVLIKHLESGNSYGIVLKRAHTKFLAARARPVGRGVADGGHRLAGAGAGGLGAAAALSQRKRRSLSALATTETLEKRHREPGDERVEQARGGKRQGGDVVAERPAQVLLDRAQRRARQADGVGGGARIAGDQREVGGLDGHVGAGADGQPEVGLRERGGVVDAVADHRDDPPLGLQATHDVDLVRREHLGDDLVDADRGGHRVRGGGVVAGEQQRTEPERPQGRDRFRGGRLDRVGDGEQPARLAVPGHEHRGPSRGLGGLPGGVQPGRDLDAPVGEEGGPPDLDAVAVDHAFDAQALAVRERLDRGQGAGLVARGARDRLGDRVLGRVLERARDPQELGAVLAVGDDDVDERHAAAGDGPRLVEHDRVDAARGLEHLGALDEQSELGAAAGAHEQCGGGGQAERARAGDDEDGDGGGERERGVLAGAEPEPQRGHRQPDHDGHEDGGDTVGEPLHGRLAALGVAHQPRDLCERGVGADPRGPDHEPPAGVDRGAGDGVAGLLLDRHGLAGEQRLVDRASTLLDDPVGGDLLAGAHDEAVAGLELLDRDAALGAGGSSRATSLAPSSSRPVSAAPARRLARASKYRPARMNTVTALATSR